MSTAAQPATATMVALIGSYADNKGALGRRYGEWAVSAPTIEAAVAAAAMAQDELGHARATYPVLAKLGVERADDTLDTSGALPFIASELPDWAAMIAANLVVDGILTTWAASVRDSSIEPLAQRARKILQEEGSHKLHAQGWARRFCRAGGADLELLMRRIEEMWAQAARWPGPDDDPGYREAVARGMVSGGPAVIRGQVREWLTELVGAEGVSVALPEPDDWSDWDERYRYLIELGRMMAPLPQDAYTEANKVRGCASQVWLETRIDRHNGDAVLHLRRVAGELLAEPDRGRVHQVRATGLDDVVERARLFIQYLPKPGQGRQQVALDLHHGRHVQCGRDHVVAALLTSSSALGRL